MAAIRAANDAAGRKWFRSDTMRFWGSTVVGGPYQGPHGVTFVTHETMPEPSYNIRTYTPDTASVGTAEGGWLYSLDKAEALSAARSLARTGILPPAKRPAGVMFDGAADLPDHPSA